MFSKSIGGNQDLSGMNAQAARYMPSPATAASVHRDPRAGRAVQQPLQMEAGELIVRALADLRREGRQRAGIARFQLGEGLQIARRRRIVVLLPG